MHIKDIQDYIKMKQKNRDVNQLIDDVLNKIKQIDSADWKQIYNEAKTKFRVILPSTHRLALNRYQWENLINTNPEYAKKAIALVFSINDENKIDNQEFKKYYHIIDL